MSTARDDTLGFMRVLIDVRLLSRGGASGIHEYTRSLTNELLTRPSANRYTLFYTGIRKLPLPFAKENEKFSVINWPIPNKILDVGFRFCGTPELDTLTKSDLVLSPHIHIVKTKRPARIMTFHDLSFVHYPQFFSAKQRVWHALQDWKSEARRAAHIVADSAFTKTDLVALGIAEEKISVVYPGIDASFRKLDGNDPARVIFRKKYALSHPYILFLGTLEPRKNINAVIRAFSELKRNPRTKDLKLVIAGNPGWLYDDVIKEAKNSPVRNDIIFLGSVEDSERVLLYNEARAFVYPSFFEGFGFPPLEAQASGCPVVVSNRTSLPETIEESGITVNPWDVHALAEGISTILEDSIVRDAYIEKGLANAKRFSWETAAAHIEQILENAHQLQ